MRRSNDDTRRFLATITREDLLRGLLYWIEDYVEAGCPFGRSLRGLGLWLRFLARARSN